MATGALKAAFRLALLILVTALAILPFQPGGSPNQVVTILAAMVGALFLAAVWLVARWSAPALPPRRTVSGGIDHRRPGE